MGSDRVHHIAVMPGDGVGPELIEQGLKVLASAAALDGFRYELVHFPHSARHYLATGEVINDESLSTLAEADAILFGAAGDPSVPEGEMRLTRTIYEELDLGISIRPARLYADWLTPLRGVGKDDVDLIIVRDSTEDAFVAPGGIVRQGTQDEISLGLLVYTRLAVERTARRAFELAESRRRRLLLVTQSNAVPSHKIWNRTVEELKSQYPDVEVETTYPDTAAQMFVDGPQHMDVVLTTYWLGGIYSNLAGAVVGGVGVIGSARLNFENRKGWFEPSHGSAPKYTGLDKVSPIATIKAVEMMLSFLGEYESARRIEVAISDVLVTHRVTNVTTRGPMGTVEAAAKVLEAMENPSGFGLVGLASMIPQSVLVDNVSPFVSGGENLR